MNIQEKELQDTKKAEPLAAKNTLHPNDAKEILVDVFRLLRESGLTVGVKNRPARNENKAGLLIYVSDLYYENGEFFYAPDAKNPAKKEA